MPDVLADALARIAAGRRAREEHTQLGSDTITQAETRGRLMVAVFIAQYAGDHCPPRWPDPIRASWDAVERAMRGGVDDPLASVFGSFRYEVTQLEVVAAASLATLLRAWSDLLRFAAEDPDIPRFAARIRDHVRGAWQLRIVEPPPVHHIDDVARRFTRRYGLLPPRYRAL